MYYIQIGVTIVLVLGIMAALFNLLTINIKLVIRQLNKRDAMQKTFISSFLAVMSILLTVIIWQDKANWSTSVWIVFLFITAGFSLCVAIFFALMYWNWKE